MLWLAPAFAARITVDASGAGDFTDPQSAVIAAAPGDYVVIEPGVYPGFSTKGYAGPIAGLSPDLTIIDHSGTRCVEHGSGGELFLRDLTLRGAVSYGVDADADLRVERVRVLGIPTGIDVAKSTFIGESLTIRGASTALKLTNVKATLEQLTLTENTLNLNVGFSTVSLGSFIFADGTPLANLLSKVTAAGGLFASGSWASATLTRVVAGDPGFLDWTANGDWSDDDLGLAEGSAAIDAGSPGCLDSDGSVCDLGAGGGAGSRVDEDADRMDDDWESDHGLDSGADDSTTDADSDGLDALGELLFGTDPEEADTDADGVGDLVELQGGFDPLEFTDQLPSVDLVDGDTLAAVGEAVRLHAEVSDPMGEALTVSWRVRAPDGSARETADGEDTTFVVDSPGVWYFTPVVDDGTHRVRAEAPLEIWVTPGAEVRIPEDIPDLATLERYVEPGTRVRLGPGAHELGWMVEGTLQVRGMGSGLTRLNSTVTVGTGGSLTLVDLSVKGRVEGLKVRSGGRAFLRDVGLGARSHPLENAGSVVAWGTSVKGRATRSSGVLWMAHGDLEAPEGHSLGVTHLDGMDVQGSITVNGALYLHNSTVVASSGAVISGIGDLEIRHAIMGVEPSVSASLLGCSFTSLIMDYVVQVDVRPGCGEWAHGTIAGHLPIGDETLPAALDAGDWRLVDPDASPRDIGHTGGPSGTRAELGLPRPEEDADGDGLPAFAERVLGTRDSSADTDGDGVGDLAELDRGHDPADAADHHPVPESWPGRVWPGDTFSLNPAWDPDPDGDPCAMRWEDGATSGARLVDTSAPGVVELAWWLECGEGATRHVERVVVQETLRVPDDAATLDEAMALAEDHHLIVLGEGTFVGDLDLRGRPIAVEGAGPGSVVRGTVRLSDRASTLRDLWVDGDVTGDAVRINRVGVSGDLHLGAALVKNVVVRGDVDIADAASLANITVLGDWVGAPDGVRSTAVLGGWRMSGLGGNDLWGQDQGTLGPFPIIDTAAADWRLLAPWPGSPLWDGGSDNPANADLDGSPEDAGFSGGPDAWDTDTDDDGLNDGWEDRHGVDDPTADEDADGLDDAAEFAHLTDPNNWDTDGDRIGDAEDPDPRTPEGPGLQAVLTVDERWPEPGVWFSASAAGSQDPGERIERYRWTLVDPAGVARALPSDGPLVMLRLPGEGAHQLTVEVGTSDGVSDTASLRIYGRGAPVEVGPTDSLQAALDAAVDGTFLEISGRNRLENVVIRKDVLLTHAEGARGGALEPLVPGVPVVTVEGARLVRLEGLTLRTDGGPVVATRDVGEIELRRCRLVGGAPALTISGSTMVVRNTLVSGAPVFIAEHSVLSVEYSILGLAGPRGTGVVSTLVGSELVLMGSYWEWDSGYLLEPIAAGPSSRVAAGWSADSEAGWLLLREVAEPDFLVEAAQEEEGAQAADLRLDGTSPLVNAGPPAALDPDGSRADIGIFGGRFGDWPDVDNDRDGWTNLDGDCDDLDPSVVPDPMAGECVPAGCATGARGAGLLLAAFALATCKRRAPAGY